MRKINLTALAVPLLLVSTHCSSHRCLSDTSLCDTPVNTKSDPSVILSKFDETSRLVASVNDIGLRETWSGLLWQADPAMPVTNPSSCADVTGMSKACVKLNVSCTSGTCTSSVTKTDLANFKDGTAQLTVTQLPRPTGVSAKLDVVPYDPKFGFKAWSRQTVPDPGNYDDITTKQKNEFKSLGVIDNFIYITRTYANKSSKYCGDVRRQAVVGGLGSDLPSPIPCDSIAENAETPFATASGFWSGAKTGDAMYITYDIRRYTKLGFPAALSTAVALNTGKSVKLANMTASPDDSTLFVLGVDSSIYWATTPVPNSGTMTVLSTAGIPAQPSLVPVSADLLFVIGSGDAQRYQRQAGPPVKWTAETIPQIKSGANAVGAAADLNNDGFIDLIIADSSGVRFYAGDSAGGFLAKNRVSLPMSVSRPVSIAVGDLDGMPGLDLALIDAVSLHVALHE